MKVCFSKQIPIFPAAVYVRAIAGLVLVLSVSNLPDARSAGIPDYSLSATAASGVLIVCPAGDGPLLSEGGLSITVTVKHLGLGVPNIPATDFTLLGCSNALSMCAGTSPFTPGATDANGVIVLDGRPFASGCSGPGVYVLWDGWLDVNQGCVPIQMRSVDLKSSSAGACGGDMICPDGRVDLADFSYYVTRYPSVSNPAPPYVACADYASPYGSPVAIADFAKFVIHFAGAHGCP